MRVPRVIASLEKIIKPLNTEGSLESLCIPGQSVKLSAEESHHLKDVLRLKVGDEIEIFFREIQKAFSAKIYEIETSIILSLIHI